MQILQEQYICPCSRAKKLVLASFFHNYRYTAQYSPQIMKKPDSKQLVPSYDRHGWWKCRFCRSINRSVSILGQAPN